LRSQLNPVAFGRAACGYWRLLFKIKIQKSKFKIHTIPFSRVFKSYQGFSRDNLSSLPLPPRLQAGEKSEIKNRNSKIKNPSSLVPDQSFKKISGLT